MEICKICNREFKSRKSLCMHLVLLHKYTKEQIIEYYDKHYKINGEDECKFCHKKSKFKNIVQGYFYYCENPECLKKAWSSNTIESYMYKHNLSEKEAIEKFTKRSDKNGELIKKSFDKILKNDPNYNKKRSHQSKEYWISKGYSKEESIKKSNEVMQMIHKKTSEKRKNYPEKYNDVNPTQKNYWIKQGYTYEDAKNKVSERQRTFTLEKCIEKHGEEKGYEIWLKRQQKWQKNNKKSNFSKISQELFWNIYDQLNENDKQFIMFATLNNGEKDDSGHNHELRLKLKKIVLPDFINIKTKKIIEFNGTYYHNLEGRQQADKDRITMLENNGYKVLSIDEKFYYKNKKIVIQQCINFLNE